MLAKKVHHVLYHVTGLEPEGVAEPKILAHGSV